MKVYTLYLAALVLFISEFTNAQVTRANSTQSNQARGASAATQNATNQNQKPVTMNQAADSLKFAVNDYKKWQVLTQYGMPLEFFCSVKQITVGGKLSALIYIPQAVSDIQHFRIEIANPLHLIFSIGKRRPDNIFVSFTNNE